MLPSQENAQRIGIGPIMEVAISLSNVPETESVIADIIKDTAMCLNRLIIAAKRADVARVLLCAAMNLDFRKTGELWRLDDSGSVCKNYIGENAGRNAIADLAGL